VHGRSRINKTGPAKLCLTAVVATRHNEIIRAHYQRLVKNGKAKMATLIAAMRKLVYICFGVLKHQTPFQVPPPAGAGA